MNDETRRELKAIIYDLWDIRTGERDLKVILDELHVIEQQLEHVIEDADYTALSNKLHGG